MFVRFQLLLAFALSTIIFFSPVTGTAVEAAPGLDAGVNKSMAGQGQFQKRMPIERSEPIDKGIVIIDGQYIPAPYIVQRRGDRVTINGNLLTLKSSSQQSQKWQPAQRPLGRPGQGRMGPGRKARPQWSRTPNMASYVEVQLEHDVLIIQTTGQDAIFIGIQSLGNVTSVLFADKSLEEKSRSLEELGLACIETSQWRAALKHFEPTEPLRMRIAEIVEREEALQAELAAYVLQTSDASILNSNAVRYGAIVVAMLLGAVTLNSLLTNRPHRRRKWRSVDQRRAPMVVRNSILLALLGLFDLVCTAIAHKAGGFVELNPLGGSLLNNLVFLSIFKIAIFLAACVTLVSLRRYHGAQLASWWLCLVCTIVAFRWLTYNSLFIA